MGDFGQPDEDVAEVREALERAVRGILPPADLLARADRRARRIRRVRVAAVAAAVVVVGGSGVAVARIPGGVHGADPVRRTAANAPASTGDGLPAPSPSGPAPTRSSRPSSGSESGSRPASPGPASGTAGSGTRPSGTATQSTGGAASSTAAAAQPGAGWAPRPDVDDPFTGSTVDRAVWSNIYSGGTRPTVYSAWSAAQVQVSGGALQVSVAHPRATDPVADVGGVGAPGTARRYGRWEFRWRMTAGLGVIGQFLLVPASSGRSSGDSWFGATLSSVNGTLTVSDLTSGEDHVVRLNGSVWHTVVVESTPGRLSWTVDGRAAATMTSGLPQGPVWPAFQTLLTGPDCGGAQLPAACGGTRTAFPQVMEIDRFRSWRYIGQ